MHGHIVVTVESYDIPTLGKKIYRIHLERIVKHFLILLTRNIGFQDIRIS